MSRRCLILGAILALGAAGLVQADTPAQPGAITLTADQVVKARQAALRLSAGDLGAMKAAVDAGADVTQLEFSSRALANWARTLPSLFPAGTGIGDAVTVPTKARPEIWTSRPDFEGKAAAYAAAAAKLGDLAKAGDKAGWLAQFDVVRGACQACHDSYRAKDPPPAAAPAKKG